MGDVYAVPVKEDMSGLAQVVRKSHGEYFAVVFDGVLTVKELERFNFLLLPYIPVLTDQPVMLNHSKKVEKLEVMFEAREASEVST